MGNREAPSGGGRRALCGERKTERFGMNAIERRLIGGERTWMCVSCVGRMCQLQSKRVVEEGNDRGWSMEIML